MSTDPQPTVTPVRNGIEVRRERQRLEARRAILDASRELLAESPEGDFSIRSLAGKCGYSPPTVYHHFGDKHGLLAAVLDDGLAALVAELAASCDSDDPYDRLRSVLLTFIRYANEHPTFSALLDTVGRQDARPALEEVKAHLDGPVRELLDAGRLAGFDFARAEQVLWAMLHGLIAVQLIEPDHPWAPGLSELAIDSLLRGMTAGPTELAGVGS